MVFDFYGAQIQVGSRVVGRKENGYAITTDGWEGTVKLIDKGMIYVEGDTGRGWWVSPRGFVIKGTQMKGLAHYIPSHWTIAFLLVDGVLTAKSITNTVVGCSCKIHEYENEYKGEKTVKEIYKEWREKV